MSLDKSDSSGLDRPLGLNKSNPLSSPEKRGSKSYAGLVRNSAKAVQTSESGIPLPNQPLVFVEPVLEQGRVKVIPPKNISEEGKADWEKTFLGHFIGQRLPYPTLSSIANKLWKEAGLVEVLSSEKGHFFFHSNFGIGRLWIGSWIVPP